LLGWRTVKGARGTRIKKNAPQITSEWNYRPRKAIRRYAAANSAGVEISDLLSRDPFAINNNVWLKKDALECGAYTFMNLHPAVKDTTTKAPLWDHERAVSAYD